MGLTPRFMNVSTGGVLCISYPEGARMSLVRPQTAACNYKQTLWTREPSLIRWFTAKYPVYDMLDEITTKDIYEAQHGERKRNRKNEKIRGRASKIKWNRKVRRETRDVLGIPIYRELPPRQATNLKFTRLTFTFFAYTYIDRVTSPNTYQKSLKR